MKPKILIIADVPGWALDRTAENVIRRLNSHYSFKKVFNNLAADSIKKKDYDLLYITYWRQFTDAYIQSDIPQPAITGIRSHFKWDQGSNQPPSAEMLGCIRPYKAVNVPSRILYDIFKDKHRAIFHTPHGADENVFKPAANPFSSSKGELVLGWTGSKNNHPNKRGLDDLLIPALKDLSGVTLKVAAREDKWRTQNEMVNFYRSLDAYICTSRTEGGPHPILEASACGIPVISTPVGIAPELIEDNMNGLLIQRKIDSIREAVRRLRDKPDLRMTMANNARANIKQNWSWDKQALNYIPFFDKGLS